MLLDLMQLQLTVLDLIVTVLENLRQQQAAILEQVLGQAKFLQHTHCFFQAQIKQDGFGMVVAALDLLAQDREEQHLHKIHPGAIFFLQPAHKNLAAPQFTIGEQTLHHYTLFLQAPHTHQIPMLSQWC
jgi:hypothetical protein